MAIFGFHIVLTMVTATFAQKIFPTYAPCCRMLSSFLERYAMPAKHEEEVKGGRKSKKKQTASSNNSEDVLYRLPVTIDDLSKIAFTTDIEMVFDFTICSILVLLIAEIRALLFPCFVVNETNLSLVWCWIAIGLGIRALYSTLKIFMKEVSFVSVCLMSGCVFALLSMIILSFPDNFVDLKLRSAHEALEGAITSAINESVPAVEPDSPDYVAPQPLPQLNFNLFRGFLAILAGVFGTLLTFPGLRFAKLYSAAISIQYEDTGSKLHLFLFYLFRGVLHFALISPLLLALLWMQPITDIVFNPKRFDNYEDSLNSFRTIAMIAMGVSQLLVSLPLLQVHLDSAEKRISSLLAKSNTKIQPGRPAEKPADLRKEVNIAAQSLGVVGVQILTPALMMIMMGLLFKGLVGASWLPPNLQRHCTSNNTSESNTNSPQALSGQELIAQLLSKISSDESLNMLATDLSNSLARFRLAASSSPALWHSTIGFAVFWMCAVQLLTSLFGVWHARASSGDPEQSLF